MYDDVTYVYDDVTYVYDDVTYVDDDVICGACCVIGFVAYSAYQVLCTYKDI